MTFHYPGTHNGVEGFGYTFVPGKKYLLTGASGGGRSTVAQLVAGLYRCEAGTVEYPCTLHSAHEVLYVPQQAHVFQDTLRNNLALGEDFTEDAMHEALRACGLTEFLAGLPNGLDEVLRDRYACSGGEAARLCRPSVPHPPPTCKGARRRGALPQKTAARSRPAGGQAAGRGGILVLQSAPPGAGGCL